MAWNWMISRLLSETDSPNISVEVRIWRDTWTQADKAITRIWYFAPVDNVDMAKLATMVQAEINAYQTLKAQRDVLRAQVEVTQTIV